MKKKFRLADATARHDVEVSSMLVVAIFIIDFARS
jgi:hypothetical protein